MFNGIILAGGGNARIGCNKALLLIDGTPIIERIISAMESVVNKITIVVKGGDDDPIRALKNYDHNNIEIIRDGFHFRNPLFGIYAGLLYSDSDYSLVLPCDTPFVNEAILKYLLEASYGFDLTIPRWSNGYVEPLCAVYRKKSILALINDPMNIRNYSIRDVIIRLPKVRYISVDELRRFDRDLLTFYNINTFRDYKKALKINRKLRKGT